MWSVISAADFVTAALFMRGSLDDGFTTSHLVQGFIGIVIRFVCGIILMLIAPVFASYAVSVANDVAD